MQVLCTTKELRHHIANFKAKNPNKTIGLVPTMGALHNGHLSLITQSKEQCDYTIVSIFVNPTQFAPNEDFDKYPRKQEADLNICQKADVDIVFMPEIAQMYPLDSTLQTTFNAPKNMANVLEGKTRPGHFDGVLQVVLKLFNLTQPTKAFFGQKDAQQLLIIQKMVEDLFLPVTIVPCPIIRTQDGLALSSRNAYLSENGKREALKISSALNAITKAIMQGIKDSKSLERIALEVLEGTEVEYLAIVDRELEALQSIKKDSTLVLIVARIEGVRLLDNLWF
ncbi:pantoate--beta-alanine ligase [Helicobacter turcicus]|uniref:Pantothenate synthetase n=1 Tax=Helicobacter turcicus TaxID=2867412 RepID=A0ABS7JNS3_9HELI|nr:pantoate--beta-alanine ligase [Helicobacter turcicus]MBX7491066.1 pantoate--beta-alanine ligase [Helicobacter turcicus]MBX7546327.1 pantoate--beta-alanine ligase [Helicobacter turcicus]